MWPLLLLSTPYRAPEPEKMDENDCLLPHDLDNLATGFGTNGPIYEHDKTGDWWDTVQVSIIMFHIA